MAFVGGAFGIGFGKVIFGGLGQNVFNPALVGRAFLQAAFPAAITTWPAVGGGLFDAARRQLRAAAHERRRVGRGHRGDAARAHEVRADRHRAGPLLFGNTGGSLGETSALLILLCGAYLAWKRYLDWRIPASIFATVALSGICSGRSTRRATGPAVHAVLRRADARRRLHGHRHGDVAGDAPGAWIFGAGIGALVVLIRTWGGLPEGVMYAILLMNALVPFINRATRPRVFGTTRRAGGRHERDGRARRSVRADVPARSRSRHAGVHGGWSSTLGVAGALAGLLIVLVFQWAEPRILAHQARVIAAPSTRCCRRPRARRRCSSGWRTDQRPAGRRGHAPLDRVWAGYDDAGADRLRARRASPASRT
jgi:hypothetical protein